MTRNSILDINGDLRSASAIIHIIIAFPVTEPHSEAATRGVLRKKVFREISQNSQENTCARVSFLIKLQASGHIRNIYIYRAYSNDYFCSLKIHLIWAHLKFHYKLLFCSASAIPESKFSSSSFSSYPIPLWQCMMHKKTDMLFLVRQSFLPPLNYTNFFFTLKEF